jgi:hypothetical protein
MATTNTVTSGLSTIAPEIAPYYKGVGKPGDADYVKGLLPKAQELYSKDYAETIGTALDQSGLGGAGRIAQMNPLEKSVGTQLSSMQTPGQFGAGSNLAAAAGQGQLNTVGQGAGYGQMGAGYGQMGVGYGQQAAGLAGLGLGMGGQAAQAGQNYMSMATNPGAQQAFMSPYIQNALNPQLEEMRRQYGITGAQQQGNATRAGAFGGSREALMNAENSRNMGTAMNQAIGTGYQNAFQQAQQAQQYGSTLGLQGLQTGLQGLNAANQAYQTGLQGTAQGMQGAQVGLQGVGAQQAGYAGSNQAAATLGQLGTQQQASDLARLQAMSAQGSSERALDQQGIDARYQDLMNKQYFGQQQIGGMQGVLTGVPVNQSASSSAVTAPAPSMASQLAGGATSLLGLYSLYNK